MIVGIVRSRIPLVKLTIRGFRGRLHEIEAVVDSGYTGWLTLPSSLISALNFPLNDRDPAKAIGLLQIAGPHELGIRASSRRGRGGLSQRGLHSVCCYTRAVR